MITERKSGILLHITSLPGKYGIGTLGDEAYKFIDFLHETKQTYWQILPLGHTGYGNSPYASYSAFAGNPLLINLEYLNVSIDIELDDNPSINYDRLISEKLPVLMQAAESFLNYGETKINFETFKTNHEFWLDDYAFFMALKDFYEQKPLWEFDEDLKLRKPEALDSYRNKLFTEIEKYKVIQFFFFEQWFRLKSYAEEKGIKIIGDIPFYVAGDSADVWINPEIFMLCEDLTPIKVAGVPPDYFSATGQLWGNPVYDWNASEQSDYNWWKKRIHMNLDLFDYVRIDHFRAFSEFWAVPFGDKTAEHGEWLPGPKLEFLDAILKDKHQIIAEDLGMISEGVEQLLKTYKLPGMKILQFAFDSDSSNPFLPHNYIKNSVVYTGTHDNDTCMGILDDYNENELQFMKDYCNISRDNFAHLLIRMAWSSVANIAITPLQDLMQLGKDARMNTPGTIGENWTWKFEFSNITEENKSFLTKITEIYGRV
jgi:4-alpha-glucanotransferase